MDINNLILHDDNYGNEMTGVVVPFTKKYESDGFFDSYDNRKIYYRTYIKDSASKNIVIVHGYTENSEKYREIIYYFLKCDFNVFAFDLRGHGYSERLVSDISKVHIDSFDSYVKDLDVFIKTIVKPITQEDPLYVFSHSMGAAITILYLENNNNVFDKAVLSTPMISQRTFVPQFLMNFYLKAFSLLKKDESYLLFLKRSFPKKERFDLVSFGSEIRYSYYFNLCSKDDCYKTFSGTVGWMRACSAASNELKKNENIEKINIPLLVYNEKHDTRVRYRSSKRFCEIAKNVKVYELKNKVRHEVYTAKEPILKEFMYNVLEFFN